jgi:hypothetical protein
MIDANFDLYQTINDNDDFAKVLFDPFFDRYLEGRQEGQQAAR